MTIYIFTGPTLSPDEGRAVLDAVYLPPAAQGDVYRAALERPRAIGIIDGYFERIPSVWHKEILWAMEQGIHVFGSASMGALRAAELKAFGMEGVGAIFDAYHAGELEDDDEVAVAHGQAESGYVSVSEAMVNIRATLRAAADASVIAERTEKALIDIAKALFYADRSYPAVLARGAEAGLSCAEVDALRAWLPVGRINQKRRDALAMLESMKGLSAENTPTKRVAYSLEHTDAWDQVRRRAGKLPLGRTAGSDPRAVVMDALLEELRTLGQFERVRMSAMTRAFAIEEARRRGVTVSEDVLAVTAEVFRRERGLFEAHDVERWMEAQRMSVDDLTAFLREEALVRWIDVMFESEATRHVLGHLRAAGEYGGLLDRVEDKHKKLSAMGLESPSLSDVGMTEESLWRVYFQECLGREVPIDLLGYALRAGFSDVDALRRSALREICYARLR